MTRIDHPFQFVPRPAASGTSTPLPASTTSRHGETLADVAARTGQSEAGLQAANPDLPRFDALPADTRVRVPADSHLPSDPVEAPPERCEPATPRQTLEAIEAMPEPNVRDLPPQLPDDDLRAVLEQRQAAHDARVLALAESALAGAEPPQLSDYDALPPATARMEHAVAAAQYQADIAALRDIVGDIRQRQLEDVPGFSALPEDTQQALVAGVRSGEYTISGGERVEDHDFGSGTADATRFEVTVDGVTTPVYLPVEPDPALDYHGLDEVAAGLASMPAEARARIERIDVTPARNPDDAYWAEEYDSPGFRSYMTAGEAGVVSIYPSEGGTPEQSSLDGALLHETGHIVSHQDFGDAEWAAWEDAIASDGEAVSDYATNSSSEDFAETYKLYLSVVGTPAEAAAREQFPARFEILDGMVGGG